MVTLIKIKHHKIRINILKSDLMTSLDDEH